MHKNSIKSNLFKDLKQRLLDLAYLNSTIAVLSWDMEVNMPAQAAEIRAKKISYLSGLVHDKITDPKLGRITAALKKIKNLTDEESAIVREVDREVTKAKTQPPEFVRELTFTQARSHHVWAQARKTSNFKSFAPYLAKIVELKRQQANFLGYKKTPYDAMLDQFEPGATADELSPVLNDLKIFLVDLLKRIKASKVKPSSKNLNGDFDIAKQREFNELVAKQIGFDFNHGRLDISTHPFSTNFHPLDVRITTRYDRSNIFGSLLSTIHEAGHGMYEQGIIPENFGTPLGEAISLGIHESQSRIWENQVGRSMEFWQYFYPLLQKFFPKPFSRIALDKFYRDLNAVAPGHIRVDADEVSYNLHIIIRYEIEKELIEGTIEVKDLPKIWNAKYKEYLGVNVGNDSLGVLQDLHWSEGYFGYFPTYTLGNLYAAMFFDSAKKEMFNLEKLFSKGKFMPFREWLRRNIHNYG